MKVGHGHKRLTKSVSGEGSEQRQQDTPRGVSKVPGIRAVPTVGSARIRVHFMNKDLVIAKPSQDVMSQAWWYMLVMAALSTRDRRIRVQHQPEPHETLFQKNF